MIHGNLEVKNDLTFGNARSTEVEKEEIETSTYLWSTALESAATAGPWIVKNTGPARMMLSFKTKTTLCIGLLPTARSAGRNRSRNR